MNKLFKNKYVFTLLSIGLLAMSISSCSNKGKNCTKVVVDKREVVDYYTAVEKRSEPEIQAAMPLKHPGKVYLMDDYLFIVEKGEGVHIIDNKNPANPKAIRFIRIAGNWDIAAKGSHLYTDSYADLLVFDISNPNEPKLKNRVNDVWDWDNVIGRFKHEEREDEMVKDRRMVNREYMVPCDAEVDIITRSTEGAGQGGSMARFSMAGKYLYAVDNFDLYAFDLSNPSTPAKVSQQRVDMNIETIFSYSDMLFVGGTQGVYIYDRKEAAKPIFRSQFKHIESCDPVVVEDDYAYVTLREDASCRNAKNLLMVLDVKDFDNPKIIAEYPMQHPHGLGVKDGVLYICEGKHGLKVFDIKDKKTIDQHLIAQDSIVRAYDVIPHAYKPLLILVGDDGLFEYDISQPAALKRIGELRTFGN
jgi:hypothetical protein